MRKEFLQIQFNKNLNGSAQDKRFLTLALFCGIIIIEWLLLENRIEQSAIRRFPCLLPRRI